MSLQQKNEPNEYKQSVNTEVAIRNAMAMPATAAKISQNTTELLRIFFSEGKKWTYSRSRVHKKICEVSHATGKLVAYKISELIPDPLKKKTEGILVETTRSLYCLENTD